MEYDTLKSEYENQLNLTNNLNDLIENNNYIDPLKIANKNHNSSIKTKEKDNHKHSIIKLNKLIIKQENIINIKNLKIYTNKVKLDR